MLIGEYSHNIDKKGRIIIPSKFREEIGDKVVATIAPDGNINLYTYERWNEIYQKLRQISTNNREVRAFAHLTTAKAWECELDNQGRIRLTPFLIDYAKIDKECVIIGIMTHVEIWNKKLWEETYAANLENYDAISQKMSELGI